jgi:S-adenosyl methyltransferase
VTNDRPTGPGSTFDPTNATPAGTYAELRGSKEALPASRGAAAKVAGSVDKVHEVVQENAEALVRAVRHLAAAGHTRFADLGGGPPMHGMDARNLPDLCVVAVQEQPERRWLLLDSDVIAITHARASIGRLPGVAVVHEDLRNTTEVVAALDQHLGLDEPIAVILGAVLHFLSNEEAAGVMGMLRERLAAGSVVVVTHATSTGVDPDMVKQGQADYEHAHGIRIYVRTREEISALAVGLTIGEPGVVPTIDFLPSGEGMPRREAPHFLMWMATG